MPWLKRKSFSCLQIETDEVYNAAFRLQKLQRRSVRQLKATPEPTLSHPFPCTPSSPLLPVLPPTHLQCPSVLPHLPLPCLPTHRQMFPPLLRTGLLPLFIGFPFFSNGWRWPHRAVFCHIMTAAFYNYKTLAFLCLFRCSLRINAITYPFLLTELDCFLPTVYYTFTIIS